MSSGVTTEYRNGGPRSDGSLAFSVEQQKAVAEWGYYEEQNRIECLMRWTYCSGTDECNSSAFCVNIRRK